MSWPPRSLRRHDGLSWRDLAVARSLDSARLRAESRVQRFLDAAIELLNAGSGKDFTVQEVVERSGQSLRSFYQYFGGKHELLLALFEESVRSTADHLRARSRAKASPSSGCTASWSSTTGLCRPAGGRDGARSAAGPSCMAEFAQQLLTSIRRRRPGPSPRSSRCSTSCSTRRSPPASVRAGLRSRARSSASCSRSSCSTPSPSTIGGSSAPRVTTTATGRGAVEPRPPRHRDRPVDLTERRAAISARRAIRQAATGRSWPRGGTPGRPS